MGVDSFSGYRGVTIITNTSAPTNVVGRILGAVSRGLRPIRRLRRAVITPGDFRRVASRRTFRTSLGDLANSRGIANIIVTIGPSRVAMSVNENIANCVATNRCSSSPGIGLISRIGISSRLGLVVVGVDSRRKATVLSGHHCSTVTN